MNCKDCVHFDACMDFTNLKESELAQNIDLAEVMCDHFKNKADVAEVVRCKDCNQFSENIEGTRPIEGADGKCFIRMVHSIDTQYCGVCYDDYCSYGERKEKDNG